MRTTAFRLEDEMYAQLTIIVGLEGITMTDAIRLAVIAYIEARKESLSTKAEVALAEIEREAETRRQAIAALFGNGDAPAAPVEADDKPATRTGGARTNRPATASADPSTRQGVLLQSPYGDSRAFCRFTNQNTHGDKLRITRLGTTASGCENRRATNVADKGSKERRSYAIP
ncbi:hypothetical protein BJF78_07325 [Pseudonocardia sp. CNS-139]|nr:hypothetical protein BJF78_07325 [Pseudonocardia sp. CNS-139]